MADAGVIEPAVFPAVCDEAFAYLKVQRGRIADLAGDRAAWIGAYDREVRETYWSVAGFLPKDCARILDIGSGLGGVDVLLAYHYDLQPKIWLLDGVADAPVVAAHDRTFNHMGVARRFLTAHGVRFGGFYSPDMAASNLVGRRFDLIVSFQAWGFHIDPAAYLAFARNRLEAGGRLILDVRRGRPAWLAALHDAFRPVGSAGRFDKFDRLVFEAR